MADKPNIGTLVPSSTYTIDSAKACHRCGVVKPLTDFTPLAAKKDGRHGTCKPCRAKAATKRVETEEGKIKLREYHRRRRLDGMVKARCAENSRKSTLRRRYGLTPEQYDQILARQDGKCALCRTTNPGGRYGVFCVDHCHQTGAVRGILCHKCNVALGVLGDSISAFERVLTYVKGSVSHTFGGVA